MAVDPRQPGAKVPFNRAVLTGCEFEYLLKAVRDMYIAGDGQFGKRCEALLQESIGCHRALLTTSCTSALEMAALLLDLEPGDEVIVPAFTFVSTANAFVVHGATPVFADVRDDTLNLDERRLEGLITPRSRAIVAVHYAGVACDMNALCAVAERHDLTIVEDNAHGLFGTFRGQSLGSFGRFATLSFHETKSFTCGEGGALLLNDPADIPRAEIVRDKGTDRSRFFRGEVDKYTWVDVGSSYVMADILAGFLLAQLEGRRSILDARRAIWDGYREGLRDWARENDVRLPMVPNECDHAYHLFHLRMPSEADRNGLIEHLRAQGIAAVFHYVPLHTSPMGMRFGGRQGQCPVAESAGDTLVRLPLWNALSTDDVGAVITAVTDYECAGA
jgi:dTDP-4-amino-4,6-dideoxygalactose transaminase